MWSIKTTCIAALLCIAGALSPSEAGAEKRIGILLFNDQARYIKNRDGVIDQIRKQGFREADVKFTVESAGGSKARAVALARKFAADGMDLVIPIGTSAAIVTANEIKNIPIVFVMVWDPVESKIAKSWKSSGNNTTGASSRTSATELLRVLKEIGSINRVAVLYTPGERNSEIQLAEFEADKDRFGLRIVPVPLTEKVMVAPVISDVVSKVDALCLTGSSIVGDSLQLIVELATQAGVVTASQSEDHVEGGVFIGITVDAYRVGRLAGEKAVKVLKGANPSSIPIEPLGKLDLIINNKTAKAGRFQIPPSLMKSITNTID